ncbi:hypothetical protein HGM15179_021543, partial [Zosterops borbonicus]
ATLGDVPAVTRCHRVGRVPVLAGGRSPGAAGPGRRGRWGQRVCPLGVALGVPR